jgi:hypothetical protein
MARTSKTSSTLPSDANEHCITRQELLVPPCVVSALLHAPSYALAWLAVRLKLLFFNIYKLIPLIPNLEKLRPA